MSSGAANPYVLDNYTDYDSYGSPITKSGGTVNNGGLTNEGMTGDLDSATSYGFGGGYLDETQLIYLVHRYYWASIEQFLSVDPLLGSTRMPYAYANDSPTGQRDPTGLSSFGTVCTAGYTYHKPVHYALNVNDWTHITIGHLHWSMDWCTDADARKVAFAFAIQIKGDVTPFGESVGWSYNGPSAPFSFKYITYKGHPKGAIVQTIDGNFDEDIGVGWFDFTAWGREVGHIEGAFDGSHRFWHEESSGLEWF